MPTHLPRFECSVLLLAGGRGQRMGGRDKGLLEWRGQPLIAHAFGHVRALSDDVIVSCNRNQHLYAQYADQLVEDDNDDFAGPLAGIRAGLACARHSHVLVLPCDVPAVDRALLADLMRCAARHPGQPVIVRQGDQWEPLICVIPTLHGAEFERAWQAGERSPRKVLLALHPVALQCPDGDPRLRNFNSPETLL